MISNTNALQEAQLERLNKSEDLLRLLTDDCEVLERWLATCHVYNAQVEEIREAIENKIRSRSSETDKRNLLKDFRNKILTITQEEKKLQKIMAVINKKSQLIEEGMNQENVLFPNVNENLNFSLKMIKNIKLPDETA